MLVSRRGGELVLVEQVEHGRACGELTAHWGNSRFERPEPFESVSLASALHDEGWREEDAKPLLDLEHGRPLSFIDAPIDEHMALYARGVEAVTRRDPYAGLLVGMHWIGLYRARWGLDRAERSLTASQAAVALREEQRWIELKRGLWAPPVPRRDFEARLWTNYELLQAWDVLSLALCLMPLTPAPDDAPPVRAGATLTKLDQPSGDRTLAGVPLGAADGERIELALRVVHDGAVTVDPYPFDVPTFDLQIAARAIPDRRYGSEAELAAAVDGEGRDLTIPVGICA
jgi:Protein of unknown function (DUF3891)